MMAVTEESDAGIINAHQRGGASEDAGIINDPAGIINGQTGVAKTAGVSGISYTNDDDGDRANSVITINSGCDDNLASCGAVFLIWCIYLGYGAFIWDIFERYCAFLVSDEIGAFGISML